MHKADQDTEEAIRLLEKQMEAIGLFSGKIAHDLNNKLAIVDGHGAIAEKALGPEDKGFSNIQKMKVATAQSLEITAAAIAPWKKPRLQNEAADVVKILKSFKYYMHAFMPPGAEISVEGQGAIYIDASVQDFCTFILAWISYAGQGKSLTISIEDQDDNARLSILSEGRASQFPQEALQILAQKIGTEMHDDKVCFLPISLKVSPKIIHGSLEDLEAVSFEGYTALVVDDEPDICELVCGMLEAMGVSVIQAQNGNDALLKQEDSEMPIDILLTDVVMPEMDGLLLAELFETQHPNSTIIFMSGYPRHNSIENREVPENAPFLAKPIKQEKLVRTLFECLNTAGVSAAA